MHLRVRFIGVLLGGLLAMGQAPLPGRASATATVAVRVDFGTQTKLFVSSSSAQFDVSDPQTPPAAVINFTAYARTGRNGEVVLTVEPQGPIESPTGGPSAGDVTITYQGEGGNSGTLTEAGQHVVGRWAGSGVREGHVSFALRGAHLPGRYLLPVKFVLSTP